jgi:hypothetical protein
MIDTKQLYDVYKEYAWREYDLLERRANWLYITNTVLIVGLGFIVQAQIGISLQSGLSRLSADHYVVSLYNFSKYAIVAIPIASILLNFAIWGQMTAGASAIEGLRLRWRTIHDDPRREASELPYVTYGVRDAGPRPKGKVLTSLLPLALICIWTMIAAFGVALVIPGFHFGDVVSFIERWVQYSR